MKVKQALKTWIDDIILWILFFILIIEALFCKLFGKKSTLEMMEEQLLQGGEP